MTNTQIAFWNYREQKRHDEAYEQEMKRHNIRTEDVSYKTLAEQIRHDKKEEEIGLKQAKASLDQAKAALRTAKANLMNAKNNKEKLKWQKKVDQLEIQIKKEQNQIRRMEVSIKQKELQLKAEKQLVEIASIQAQIGKTQADTIFVKTKKEYLPYEMMAKTGTAGKWASLIGMLGIKISDASKFYGKVMELGAGKTADQRTKAIEAYAKTDPAFNKKWKQWCKDIRSWAVMYTQNANKLPLGVSP